MEHLDELFVNTVLLTLMAIVTIGVIRTKNLFAVVVLGSIYSFLMASVLVVMDAVDVAMTEASVGAGISTVLMLATLYMTKEKEAPFTHSIGIPLFVVVVTATALIIGSMDLPDFGVANAPEHLRIAPHYIHQSLKETEVPNVVTAVLASYRGFDTFGEVIVIFTAGIGVMLLLRGKVKRRQTKERIDET